MLIYHDHFVTPDYIEEDYTPFDLKKCIEKTHRDLEIAYVGFNNAVDNDLIDSYIYEINSLQMRYNHLTKLLAGGDDDQTSLYKHSPIRTIVSHVFG